MFWTKARFKNQLPKFKNLHNFSNINSKHTTKMCSKCVDCANLPIQTYGSEVWAAFMSADFENWEAVLCQEIRFIRCL